jgi:hypothetical protein
MRGHTPTDAGFGKRNGSSVGSLEQTQWNEGSVERSDLLIHRGLVREMEDMSARKKALYSKVMQSSKTADMLY